MELETTADTELDLPPEYCHYKDEGCELAESCLNCPFPRCIYDVPRGKQHLLKSLRNRQILHQFQKEGRGVKELAAAFSISQRTVQRVPKNYRNNNQQDRDSQTKDKI
jgi:hypothetical protein